MRQNRQPRVATWEWWLLGLVLAVATARVVPGYALFTHTFDEPVHIAAGMEWLDKGQYRYEAQHPPLGRITTAIGPYLDGQRSNGNSALFDEGMSLLYDSEIHGDTKYFRTLTLARLGVLPFLLLTITIAWLWAREIAGPTAAFAAAFLASTTPTLLAHGGLATTDMAMTAFLLLSLYLLRHLMLRPASAKALLTGAALAAAIGSKFSALLFIPAAALPFLFNPGLPRLPARKYLLYSGFLLLALFITLWAIYRFSWGPPLWHILHADNTITHTYNSFSTPMPELFEGLVWVYQHNKAGHLAFLMGDIRQHGWWLYFPVAIAVKTPLAMALLSLIGLVWAIQKRQWAATAPVFCGLLIVLVSLPASINIGVRHVLPFFPLLAIGAGVGAAWLWQSRWGWLAVMLLVWQAAISIQAHPDYLAHFNPVAGNKPEDILVDSNLDWGQDIKRLAEACRELNVDELYVGLMLSGNRFHRHGMPRSHSLPRNRKVSGWIAVSATRMKIGNHQPPYQPYRWLQEYKPVARIGKSIKLYHIQKNQLLEDSQ